ncbi:ankyrin repeat domain-containing protein [Desulfovibrio sp. OttesenSCG-928-C14]|nr:ankyrin repeat domain-containing protein [Desulfovibrio sp. OttesenSCG-928-C14]
MKKRLLILITALLFVGIVASSCLAASLGTNVRPKWAWGDNTPPIFQNAWKMETDEVMRQIKEGFNVNAPDQNQGWRLLHVAALRRNFSLIEALLAAGAGIDAKTGDLGWTPLTILAAMDEGHAGKACLQLLVDRGAALNAKTGYGETPLVVALRFNNPGYAAILVNGGANVSFPSPDGRFPLHWAVEGGHHQLVQAMISNGANQGLKNKAGQTPLEVARKKNDQGMIKLLSEQTHLSNQVKEPTALMLASRDGDHKIVGDLLAVGENANAKTPEGWTALMEAARNGHSICIIQLVREGGADVHAVNKRGENPLFLAVIGNHTQAVSTLLKYKPKINIKNIDGETPLGRALFMKNMAVARYLLEDGADPNDRDESGERYIVLAVQDNKLDATKLLLDAKADKTVKSNKGQTLYALAKTKAMKDLLAQYGIKAPPPPKQSQANQAKQNQQISQQLALVTGKQPQQQQPRTQSGSTRTQQQNQLAAITGSRSTTHQPAQTATQRSQQQNQLASVMNAPNASQVSRSSGYTASQSGSGQQQAGQPKAWKIVWSDKMKRSHADLGRRIGRNLGSLGEGPGERFATEAEAWEFLRKEQRTNSAIKFPSASDYGRPVPIY